MAYQANKAEKQAVASEQEAQANLSFSHHRRSDSMMQLNLSGQSLARMGYRFREHSEYSIIPEKVANHLNHHPFMRQSRTLFHTMRMLCCIRELPHKYPRITGDRFSCTMNPGNHT